MLGCVVVCVGGLFLDVCICVDGFGLGGWCWVYLVGNGFTDVV